MKFHVSPKTGKVGQCKAHNGQCPFGSEQEHFNTKEQALNHSQKLNQEKFGNSVYKSSSKTSEDTVNNENNARKVSNEHPENITNNNDNYSNKTQEVAYSEKLIFNSWIGDRRRELNRHILNNDNAKTMPTVRDFTENDINEAVKLGYLPKNLVYNVNVVEDGKFGERVIALDSTHPDKSNFEMKDFSIVPMRDGSYSIIPQTKKEYVEVQDKLNSIAEKYNMKRNTLDGYHVSDFFVHTSVEGGNSPKNIDDNFHSGETVLNNYYQGKASRTELEQNVNDFYAHRYEEKVYKNINDANNLLKQENKRVQNGESNEETNKEVANILSESLKDTQEEDNMHYRMSVSVTMDYIDGKSITDQEKKFVDHRIQEAYVNANSSTQ